MAKTGCEFEFEYDYQYYTAEAEVEYYVDSSYGSDADGLRGTSRRWIAEVEIIGVWDDEDNKIEPTEPMLDYINDMIGERYFCDQG